MNVDIRPIPPEDYPWNLLLDADPSRDRVSHYLSQGRVLGVRRGNEVCGVVVWVATGPSTCEIMNVAVAEAMRGQGLGRTLIEAAIAAARALGFARVEIGTGNSSTDQLRLYQRIGFRIFAVDRDHFTRNYPDPIVENGIPCRDMIRLSLEIEHGKSAPREYDRSDRAARPALVPELYVTGLRRSLEFYVNLLGFEVAYQRPEDGFASIRLDGAHMMLEEIGSEPVGDDEAAVRSRRWRTGTFDYPMGRGINFEVTIADARTPYDRLVSHGYPIRLDLEERWYRVGSFEQGVLQFLVMDPDGYLIRIAQEIGTRASQEV